jgi:hypothetical protein
VLYIGGEGRSGSTVLEQALAAHPHLVAVGELKYLWKWGLQNSELCACGRPVPECEFWAPVGRRLFGPEGFASPAAADILDEYEQVASNWRMFDAFLTPLTPSAKQRLERVRGFLADLYRAIGAEAGRPVVVDASKHPMHLAIVRGCPDIDLTVVQLVRDPRGVVNSWSREVALPHDPTGQRTMGPHPASAVVVRWVLMNLAVQWIRSTTKGITVRYEDLCLDPKPTLQRIFQAADADPELAPPVKGRSLPVAPGHGIAGNPSRFGDSQVVLTEDNSWRSRLPRPKQVAVTVALWPWMLAYRYLGPGTGRSARS